MEIEKKYLVKNIPFDLKNYKKSYIEQGYINRTPVIRVRKQDNNLILTVKGSGHLSREEFELNLSNEEFNNLWTKIQKKPIVKKRYFIPIENNLIAELDIYESDLKGLKTVEVEFNNINDANNFKAPKWFGDDITYNKKFKNNNLYYDGI